MGICDRSLMDCAGCPMHHQLPVHVKLLANLVEMLFEIRRRAIRFRDWIREAFTILVALLVFTGIALSSIQTARADDGVITIPCFHDPR